MLSIEQYQIIQDQLAKENAPEFVKAVISSYANTVEHASELLSFIPKLADKQLKMKQTHINQYSWAVDLLLGERYSHPIKYKKNEKLSQFCTLLYTCKAHFKSGNAEPGSIADKTFFNEFIEILKEKKEVDYTDEKDWEWIYSCANCADWLESVIKQNIDSEFVKPKDKHIRTNEEW